MKATHSILSVFLFAAIASGAGFASADQSSASTYFTVPPHMTRLLASDGSLDGVYSPIAQVALSDPTMFSDAYRYGCSTVDIDCGRKPFWSRIQLYGWVEGGFYVNAHGNTSDHSRQPDRRGRLKTFQDPLSGNSSILGNVQSTEGMLNQLWLGAKRELDTRCGFDWGFGADFLFGTDAWMAQSYGDASFDYRTHDRDYYTAIPQLYASLGYRSLSMKVGKFETLLGYEHLQAPSSFFYSRSNLFYAEPQTHSGVLFEYRFRPNLWFSFGYVQGADNSFANRFDDHGFLGGVYWRPFPSMTLWYTLYAADVGGGWYRNGERRPGGTTYRHTVVSNWKITNRWDYAFQWDLGDRSGRGGDRSASYFGTAHYLTYRISPTWKAGLRFDQLHSRRPMVLTGFSRPNTGYFFGDLYSLTLGFNWTPHRRVEVRPELRFDHAADCRPFDDGTKSDQFSAGCGLLYRF